MPLRCNIRQSSSLCLFMRLGGGFQSIAGNFLKILKSVGNKVGNVSNKNEEKDISFDEMYHRIKNNLKSIDSQEITITGILSGEYDDWYDSSYDAFSILGRC